MDNICLHNHVTSGQNFACTFYQKVTTGKILHKKREDDTFWTHIESGNTVVAGTYCGVDRI